MTQTASPPANNKPATLSYDHRVLLMEELFQRYSRGSGVARNFRFWRKKYAWFLVVGGAKAVKRLIDILAGLSALVLLSPLFLVVALLIKLTDRGPVLFWQNRVGRWGREFPFPKFRSMVVNAEEIKKRMEELMKLPKEELARLTETLTDLDPKTRRILTAMKNDHSDSITFKMKNDPRVTWIGKYIRKLSIDELPQLWCVLKGDMSLVGPRPPVPREVAKYTLADRRRLDIKPGLTCIWQVSGRGEIPFGQQVEMDVDYIQSQSVWLDIKLLLKTIPAVLTGRGAF
jgi:lipopolysaccharide/colanic/teichoic acid biosynthesis glycosyltransferase